jgi:hypothetical protein
MKVSAVLFIAICTFCMSGCIFGQTVSIAFYNDASCNTLGSLSPMSNPNTIVQNSCSKVSPGSAQPFLPEFYAMVNCSGSMFHANVHSENTCAAQSLGMSIHNTSGFCMTENPLPPFLSFKFTCNAAQAATTTNMGTGTAQAATTKIGTTTAAASNSTTTPAKSTAKAASLSFISLIFAAMLLF